MNVYIVEQRDMRNGGVFDRRILAVFSDNDKAIKYIEEESEQFLYSFTRKPGSKHHTWIWGVEYQDSDPNGTSYIIQSMNVR